MPGILLSGPAGAGKSRAGRDLLATLPHGVLIDFQDLYASLLGLSRDAQTGRYPERDSLDAYALALAEYLRRAAITGALGQDLDPVVTNSDGNPARRRELLALLGAGARETILDPGIDVVTSRLVTEEGNLSRQCQEAVNRWYGRLNS